MIQSRRQEWLRAGAHCPLLEERVLCAGVSRTHLLLAAAAADCCQDPLHYCAAEHAIAALCWHFQVRTMCNQMCPSFPMPAGGHYQRSCSVPQDA
ncbi:hypothetical protein EYF80_047607 [Liparis tanakae]|uniref:Uncharacterized protein n=1 Tax=Liparis tanakae TaxID=230148 RepID=A0A4Z2FPI0_9TELE|nr:hypothetical protein EYF80_047607 [Liparis tanakae]